MLGVVLLINVLGKRWWCINCVREICFNFVVTCSKNLKILFSVVFLFWAWFSVFFLSEWIFIVFLETIITFLKFSHRRASRIFREQGSKLQKRDKPIQNEKETNTSHLLVITFWSLEATKLDIHMIVRKKKKNQRNKTKLIFENLIFPQKDFFLLVKPTLKYAWLSSPYHDQ